MNPTLGRIVYFHEDGGPYTAIVTAINDDGSIELATFGRNSLYFQHGVRQGEPGQRGTWTWPPVVKFIADGGALPPLKPAG